jgi:hypothetical protein
MELRNIEKRDSYNIGSGALENYVDYINRHQITSLVIKESMGYKHLDINFLYSCPGVENLIIDCHYDLDITSIEHLKSLKSLLSNAKPKKSICLDKLPKLESISIEFYKNWKGIENCKSLREIALYKYKIESLETFSLLQNLEEIRLIQGDIKTLKGITSFKKLKSFKGHNLSRLEKLDFGEGLENLEQIEFSMCKKIYDFDDVKSMKNLKSLILSECDKVKSIKFISELTLLERCTVWLSDITDGDMSPFLNIQEISFTNKKHYSHTLQEIMLPRLNSKL